MNDLRVDYRGSDLPVLEVKLGVTLPTRDPLVADLLSDPDGARYRHALRWLLSGVGLFPQGREPLIVATLVGDDSVTTGAMSFVMPDVRTTVPRPAPIVRGGRAHVWLSVRRTLPNHDTTFRLGQWAVTSKGGRVTAQSFYAPQARKGVTLIQHIEIDGAEIREVAPAPERARNGRVRWLGFAPVRVTATEPTLARAQLTVAGLDGSTWQRALYAVCLAMTALWPFLVLTGLLMGRWRWAPQNRDAAADLRSRLRTLAVAALVLAGLLVLDVVKTGKEFVDFQKYSAAAIGLPAMAILALMAWRRGRHLPGTSYLALLASVVVAGLLGTSLFAFVLPAYGDGGQMNATVAAVATAVGVFGLLALGADLVLRWACEGVVVVPLFVRLMVALVVAGLVVREVVAGWNLGKSVQMQYRLGLDLWDAPPAAYLVTDLYDYGAAMIAYLLEMGVQVVLLVLLFRVLVLRARESSGLVPDREAAWTIVVLFAVFVGGLSGVWSYTLPLSMLVAGGLLASVLAWRRRAVLALAKALVPELRRREMWLTIGRPWDARRWARQAEPAQAASVGVTPSALLAAGPGPRWWENGRTAIKLGMIPALLPAAHYLWAQYAQGDVMAAGDAYGLLDLLEAGIREYAFWLVGAFTFGAFYLWWPGSPGFVKGLTPALVFAISQGVVELMPGTFDVLNWPVMAVETGLYFTLLGGLMDWATLRAVGLPLRAVETIHGIDRTRLVIAYLSPVAAAAFFILQQVVTGEAQQTLSTIIDLASGHPSPAGGTLNSR